MGGGGGGDVSQYSMVHMFICMCGVCLCCVCTIDSNAYTHVRTSLTHKHYAYVC